MSHKHHRNVRWTTRTVYFYSAQKQLRFAALWSSFAPPFSHYGQQLEISQETGDRRGEGTVLWNRADEYMKLGRRDEAIADAQLSLKIKEEIEDPNADQVRQALADWGAPQD